MMKTYTHRFDSPTGYLHHRPPYLMVDRVVSITSDEVVTEKQLGGDEFFLAGHFPGAPVLPGAMMQEMATQSGGILIAGEYNPMEDYDTSDPDHNEYALGVLVKVNKSRFRGFARPGQCLEARVTLRERVDALFDFTGTVSADGKTIMQNQFQLTNLRSSVLTGR